MELGATVCLPNGAPQCDHCPLSGLCRAHGARRELDVPVRTAKKPRRQEIMTVFLLESDRGLAICKRPGRGLLAGLWEFPHVPGKLEAAQALEAAEELGVRPRSFSRWWSTGTSSPTWSGTCGAIISAVKQAAISPGQPERRLPASTPSPQPSDSFCRPKRSAGSDPLPFLPHPVGAD